MNNTQLDASVDPSAKLSVDLSVVVPIFNEEEVLPAFHRRLSAVLKSLPISYEVIYVDDGSRDHSLEILESLRYSNPWLGIATFSRNFGKEEAVSAGLHYSSGKCVVIIDSDLQDPPELIPSMLEAWRGGADVVNMRRTKRFGESPTKRFTAYLFYRVINLLSKVYIPPDVGDYRLLSRRAVNALNSMPERSRFMKGLFAWIGYRQAFIDYRRDPRQAGVSKWRYWKLWNFALEGITGFSIAPLKIASYIGFACALFALALGIYFIFKTLLLGEVIAGFPTLITSVLFMGGIQLIALGIIGEYLGRLYLEVKHRPLYITDKYLPPESVIR